MRDVISCTSQQLKALKRLSDFMEDLQKEEPGETYVCGQSKRATQPTSTYYLERAETMSLLRISFPKSLSA